MSPTARGFPHEIDLMAFPSDPGAMYRRWMEQEAEHMFYHGYDNYMNHAFPDDELRPLSCKPLTRDRLNPSHIELNDALGNYSLTLIDSLTTLAILASGSTRKKNKALDYFQENVIALVGLYGDGTDGKMGLGSRGRGFDSDSKVQVFEMVIRGVGGLLSAHLFAIGELPIRGYEPYRTSNGSKQKAQFKGEVVWSPTFTYDGQLLRLAHDLGKRLLPAFYTATGLPYPRVNLRHGVPFYPNSPFNNDAERGQCQTTPQPSGELTETCSAGAGSLVLEFITLSRLTGDSRFEQLGKRAFWSVWERRSNIGLIGSGIDAESGLWTSPFTGIGAGIDSFFEYAAKAYILLSGSPRPIISTSSPPVIISPLVQEDQQSAESFLQVWHDSHAAIKRHLYRGSMYIHPHYIQADLYTGAARAFWMDSLSAFFPGLLTLTGDLEEAVESHLLFTALWTRYSALPERWSTASGSIEGGLGWWGGRPEFIESTYHLYRATRDPWYLHVGEMVLRDIKRRCWTRCGWSGIQDVRSGERNDRMESFFLGETIKYLFLLFDPDHPFNTLDAPFVFNTEGHPLIIPRSSNANPHPKRPKEPPVKQSLDSPPTCPLPPSMIPFSISATATRPDLFHAANLARLHYMPNPSNIESPLIEFSSDHPSISLSDLVSPSNYTYYPWTLSPSLIPHNATCSKIAARPTFDITFPAHPSMILGPGILQRVGNGILVNSMGGLRLGMIQDVSGSTGAGGDGDFYRVQAINNIALGKDEKIFLAKDVVSSVVNPQDPNFTRVRDNTMLDLVIDIASPSPSAPHPTPPATLNSTSLSSSKRLALSSLLPLLTSLIHSPPPSSPLPPNRIYLPAITPTGPGAIPLPDDIEEALGPDASGSPQGPLLWHTIYIADTLCDGPLPTHIPATHQIIIAQRGGCSFSRKLDNIPAFPPGKTSLRLVVVVSFEEEEAGDGVPEGWMIRPLLERVQGGGEGLVRREGVAMVMIGGGRESWDLLSRAVGVGVKRRWSVLAQGVPISNLIII